MSKIVDNRDKDANKAVAYINPAKGKTMDDVIEMLRSGDYVMEVYTYTSNDGEIKEALAIKSTK